MVKAFIVQLVLSLWDVNVLMPLKLNAAAPWKLAVPSIGRRWR